jgi:uncharacterized protein (TIGR00290 family)
MTRRVAFHWSGGKDSALALSLLRQRDDVVIERLVTTVHVDRGESTVHGVPMALMEAQARSIGIPLQTVAIPGPGLEGYVDAMQTAAVRLRDAGVDAFAFGDLSSSDVLGLKEAQFGPLGLEVIEPLWGRSSRESVEMFLSSGLCAVTVVVDAAVLDRSYVGVALDRDFVDRLPPGVDPSGELGEYHSFVHDGPLFRTPVTHMISPVRRLEREIRTTEGLRRYAYWLATPQPVPSAVGGWRGLDRSSSEVTGGGQIL